MKFSIRSATAAASRLAIAWMFVSLTACGGGGGGGGPTYSISLSSSSLTFDGTQGINTAPQTVTVNFVGDGVIVGTLPGQTMPSWLSISPSSPPAGGQVQFQVQVFQFIAPGDYSTTLRFVSGKADGSKVVTADLQISFRQRAPFGITGGAQSFQAIEGASTATNVGTTPLAVAGDNIDWTATSNQPWLIVNPTSGAAAGPIAFTVDPTGMVAGNYSGQIAVRDSVSNRTLNALVQLTVRVPEFRTSISNIIMNVDAATMPSQVTAALTISDELDGANAAGDYSWTIAPSTSLIRVSTSTGRTSPIATVVTVDLDPTLLNAVRSGQVTGQLRVTYTRGSVTSSRNIPVTVNVRLPLAGSANPYVVTPGSSGRITIVGSDFQDVDLATVRIGGLAPTSSRRLNSQEIEVDYPALGEGQYAISFVNALGLSRSAAEISAVAPVAVGTGEVSSSGGKKARLIFDSSRGVLYAADNALSEVQRFQWNGSGFVALTPVTVPSVRDLALARNNRELFAVSYGGFYTVDTTQFGSQVALQRIAGVDLSCGGAMYRVAVPEDGTVLGSPFGNACTLNGQYGNVVAVDLLTWKPSILSTTATVIDPRTPSIAASPSGRYLAVGNTSTSSGSYFLQDMRTRTPVDFGDYSRYLSYYYYALDVNEAGTRVLVNSNFIRNDAGATVCFLPTNKIARLTHSGNKAYAYLHVAGGGGRVAVFDTSVGAPMGGACAEIAAESIPVPYDMGTATDASGYEPNYSMTLAEDQGRIFLSGPSRIVALALP